jgi:CheY-like chemotaxis protein
LTTWLDSSLSKSDDPWVIQSMTDRSGRILVAEDNDVMSDILRFNLERVGYGVTVANNGVDALGHLQRDHFDLLIADYQMPGLDGESLCRLAREKLSENDLPILLCTAKGLEFDVEQLQARCKVAKVLFKPFSVREVLATVEALICP